MRETALKKLRLVKQKEKEVLQVLEERVICSLREDHSGADIHTTGCGGQQSKGMYSSAYGESVPELASGQNCGPWRKVHSEYCFPAENVTLWRTHTGAVHS